MIDSITSVIKTVMEKHLMPAIVSIGAAFGIILLLPADNWMVIKIGFWGVGAFSFCLFYIVIGLIQLIAKRIAVQIRNEKRRKENLNNRVKKVWNTVDHLPERERRILKTLIDNDNEPYAMREEEYVFSDFPPEFKDFFVSTVIEIEKLEGIKICNTINRANSIGHIVLFKLKPERYEELKYSREKYGRLSNFE